MSAFIVEFWSELRARVPMTFWAVVTMFIVTTGPFGTYAATSALQRLVLVLPLIVVICIIGTAVRTAVFQLLPAASFRVTAFVTAALACLFMVPTVRMMMSLLLPQTAAAHPSLIELTLLVGSLSLGLTLWRRTVDPSRYARALPAEVAAEPPPPAHSRLLQRIEPELRGELVKISVRDHYVDVQTSAGLSSLLLRFGDAMSEAGPVEGDQVHRSHWVAWSAVDAVERDGAKLFLRLKHGEKVPVSKNHREKLEQRGLV